MSVGSDVCYFLTNALVFGLEKVLVLLLLPLKGSQLALEVRLVDGTIVPDVLRDVVGFSVVDFLDLPQVPQVHFVPHLVSNQVTTCRTHIQTSHCYHFKIICMRVR